jgi:hypothetical protein
MAKDSSKPKKSAARAYIGARYIGVQELQSPIVGILLPGKVYSLIPENQTVNSTIFAPVYRGDKEEE